MILDVARLQSGMPVSLGRILPGLLAMLILLWGNPAGWGENSLPIPGAVPKEQNRNTRLPETQSGSETMDSADPKSPLPPGVLDPVLLKTRLQKNVILPLTLEDALKIALGQNVSIGIAQENVQQQRLDYIFRLSDLLPDLIIEYTQSQFDGVQQIFGNFPFTTEIRTVQPQLTLNYTIYTAGRNIFEIRASKQRLAAQRNLAEDARQDALRQVALAYYDLQKAYWQRAIALQAIREAQVEVALNQERLEAGIGVRLDLLQSQTFLSQRQQDLIQAENAIATTATRLSRLLALDFQVDVVPASLEATVHPLVPEERSTENLLATAKSSNPRLQAYYDLQRAAKTDLIVAITDLFPKIDVQAYINWTGSSWNDLGFTRFAGVIVSSDILENLGLAKPIRIAQAKSDLRLSGLNLRQVEELLEESLANSLINLETIKNQIEDVRETLSYAQIAYNHAVGRLREGVGTTLDVQNAATALTRARSDLAMAFLEYNRTQVNLLADLGLVSIETLTRGCLPNAIAAGH